uniref:Uncharacterized protein n=1 Tax=Lactuca sativa TaxID=4236 RepID=A0A9R1WPM5_LACSA|nr:hypothetical protein LSAT_V11C900483180 [Lactuca sativa]
MMYLSINKLLFNYKYGGWGGGGSGKGSMAVTMVVLVVVEVVVLVGGRVVGDNDGGGVGGRAWVCLRHWISSRLLDFEHSKAKRSTICFPIYYIHGGPPCDHDQCPIIRCFCHGLTTPNQGSTISHLLYIDDAIFIEIVVLLTFKTLLESLTVALLTFKSLFESFVTFNKPLVSK